MGHKTLITLALASVLALGGCSAVRNKVAESSAEGSDAAFESSVWAVCNASSVGAVRRAIQKNDLDPKTYSKFCGDGEDVGEALAAPDASE